MAKIGEGDARWIVEQRDDGRNVNSWHWEEKDITASAKTIFKKLFEDASVVNDSDVLLRIAKVDKLEGDASINIRKGKTLLVFDLDVTCKWEGEVKAGAKKAKGTIEFSFTMEDADDFEVQLACEGSGDHDDRLKNVMRTKGVKWTRERVLQFGKEIREANAQYLRAPNTPQQAKAPASPSPAPAPAPVSPAPVVAGPSTPPTPKEATPTPAAPATQSAAKQTSFAKTGVRVKTLHMTLEFRAPPAEIYNTLLDSGRVSAFTQSAASISRDVGGSFSMFGGAITGEQVTLSPPFKIVQKWRSNQWPQGHFSTCDISLQESKEGTTIELNQKDVPEDDYTRTLECWRNLYWDRMKMLFGFVSLSSD